MRRYSAEHGQKGFSLIELITFLVIIAVALAALISVFTQGMRSVNDPLIRTRALELAQAQLDAILARKFDENTPSGGIPACGASGGLVCAGIAADAGFDDVGDFNGFNQTIDGYQVSVSVVAAGSELGLANSDARRISVSVSSPGGAISALTLSAYKVNF